MTTDNTTDDATRDPEPGVIHFRHSMAIRFTEHESRVVVRGETIDLTPAMIELSRDRNGVSHFRLLDDPQEQVRKWGKQIYARGACPPDVYWWNAPGNTADRRYARDLEMQEAELIRDPVAKYERVMAIKEKFGRFVTNHSEASWG
jgi:hypothetical protein